MTTFTPLTPDTVLVDRYEVIREIGRGGMGAVYEIIDRRLLAPMALKQIVHTAPELRKAFEREARLLAKLHHESLPDVKDYFSLGDSDFITMEFIEGDDFETMLGQRGALPAADVLRWADQLLDVVGYLHTLPQPIIHRDIKPQNIKLTSRDRVMLLDFGIAKGRVGSADEGTSVSVHAYTRHYAAPEQILRQGTDERSDLFSIAATLYHLLTNRRPVSAQDRLAEEQKRQPDPLQPVHEINSGIPTTLGDLLDRAMSLHPSERPPTANAFRDALRAIDLTPAYQPSPAPTELTGFGTDTGQAPAQTPEQPGNLPAGRAVEPQQGTNEHSHPAPVTRRSAGHGAGSLGTSGSQKSLQRRIHALVRQTLDSYDGAWMVWCDPRGDWAPLLRRIANDTRMGGFTLVSVDNQTAGEAGGPRMRQLLQARLDAGESFVLLVPRSAHTLGWIWAQALLAERIYSRSLREQLLDWGWRPHSLTVSDDEIALLALQYLTQDPAQWGGGGLQPDAPLLLEVLAGGADPEPDNRMLLDLTVDAAGIPPIDHENLARWRSRALARLLVTQAHQVAPKLIGEANELLIGSERRAFALRLLDQWLDSLRLSRGLREAIARADRITMLGSQLTEATIRHGPFLSQSAERAVFAHTCQRLAQRSGKDLLQSLGGLRDDIVRHKEGLWGSGESGQAIPWNELLRLSRAAQTVLDVSPLEDWATPTNALEWYTNYGWRLDQAGEELLRDLLHPAPELVSLIGPVRAAFRARWERYLINWSEVWTGAGCPRPAVGTAGEWLKDLLRESRPTAIMMIDALRYDHGSTLAERINDLQGAHRAMVHPRRAPLPSVTAVGMATALPISESDLVADLVNGAWQVRQTDVTLNLSIASERRTWWQRYGNVPADGLLTVSDVQTGAVPEPTKQRSRVIIFDASLDKLGHDDELEGLGSTVAVDRYVDVVTKLYEAGWGRILVVTDHGYIHWTSNEEKSIAPPIAAPAAISRRAAVYPRDVALTGPRAIAPGGLWQVALPRGASNFRAYGGRGYFHGGASLQEWIIPCVQIEWPVQTQPIGVTIEPLPQVLSQRPRVAVTVVRNSLFIEYATPRTIDVVIRDARARAIFFRSDPIQINPDQEKVNIALKRQVDVVASRGTRLRIEVRDTRTEEVIAAIDSTLMTDLTGW